MTSLSQSLDQRVIKTFKVHNIRSSIGRIFNAMEEKEPPEKVWKDHTTADAIVVIEKATKAKKPGSVSFYWRTLCPNIVNDFTEFETIKEIMNDIVDKTKKLLVGGGAGKGVCSAAVYVCEGFQDIDLEETEELIDTTPNKWTEDDLMERVLPNQSQTLRKKTERKPCRKHRYP